MGVWTFGGYSGDFHQMVEYSALAPLQGPYECHEAEI